MPEKSAVRRVAVLAGSSLTWRERVMRGIAGYSAEHGRWHVYTAPEGAEASLFFSEHYRWDGLIVRVTGEEEAKRVTALGVPAVSIGSVRIQSAGLPRVKVNDEKLTGLALRHLAASGLRRFAYCGTLAHRAAEDRGPSFARAVAEAGYGPCEGYHAFSKLAPGVPWQRRQADLARWVKRLKKPVGVLTWNPDVACQLIEACHRAGVNVPGDVAVIAGDDDEMKCLLSNPTVSAVEVPAGRIGYEAAALLDRLMKGAPPPSGPVLVDPSGMIRVRESSVPADLAERDLQQAVVFMRQNLARAITMDHVAGAINVSRRWLERHCRATLGRSPREELRRLRLEAARKMLLETDLPAGKIAAATGFRTAPYLTYVFRRETKLTPQRFRSRYR